MQERQRDGPHATPHKHKDGDDGEEQTPQNAAQQAAEVETIAANVAPQETCAAPGNEQEGEPAEQVVDQGAAGTAEKVGLQDQGTGREEARGVYIGLGIQVQERVGRQEAGAGQAKDGDEEEEEEEEEEMIHLEGHVGSQGGTSASELASLLEQLTGMSLAGMGAWQRQAPERKRPAKLLQSFDLAGVAELIKAGKAQRIVCMCGAGISVSAGIPDFRTPGTGLYSQLDKYKLPRPEAVFSLDYFRNNPRPFHLLAKELYPGRHKPTPTHYFMTLLEKKGLLLRCFTQNIDSLETLAGLPRDKLVAAHGNFDSASCIRCSQAHSTAWVKENIMAGKICHCTSCSGLVKPDIVFFGEGLPKTYFNRSQQDLPTCDLLIVMGTSLAVHPFAGLLYQVPPTTPRLLVNREVVGEADEDEWPGSGSSTGFQFQESVNYRDALFLGDCDEGTRQLADLLGWRQELEQLVSHGHAAIDAAEPAERHRSDHGR